MKAHKLDAEIARCEKTLDVLRAIRTQDIVDAHCFTAADFRITIEDDRYGGFSLEDIIGDPAGKGDAPSVFEWQAKVKAAYYDERNETHGGIWSLVVQVSERNPETGEFELAESTGGVFHLGCDGRDALLSHAREIAADFLPEGIDVNDVEIITE